MKYTDGVIPGSVKSIGASAFRGNNLKSARVPNNTTFNDNSFDEGVDIV